MKLLTKDTDYAITALCRLAANRQTTFSVSTLAAELGISLSFLRKVLQELQKAGILSSRKGKNGGFTLARNPDRILVYDVIKVFQGPLRLTDCRIRNSVCHRKGECRLQKRLNGIEGRLIAEFKTISIESLIN